MNKRKSRIGIVLALLLVLIGSSSCSVYRAFRQARLDHALIEAINVGDDKKALEALADGASGEAREKDHPPTLWAALLQMWDPIRSRKEENTKKHLPALLLLYAKAYDESNQRQHWTNGPDITLVDSLLKHGADVRDRYSIQSETWLRFNKNEMSPLHFACCFSNRDAIRILLEHGADLEAVDTNKRTPLIIAAMFNQPNAVRILLEHGANTETEDNQGMAALIKAAGVGHDLEISRLLLNHHANVDSKDRYTKSTPLLCATICGNLALIRLLLEHGAKVDAKGVDGQTALNINRSSIKFFQRSDPDSRKLEETLHQIDTLLRKYGAK